MKRAARASALCLALAGLGLGPAQAQTEANWASRVWVNAGFYSYHFNRDQGLRDANPGLGAEYRWDDTWSVTGGAFTNSENRRSHYLGVYYQPWRVLGARAGVVVGGFDGYVNANHGGWFPAVIPVLSWEGERLGLNAALVPSIENRLHGALSLQLKWRVGAP